MLSTAARDRNELSEILAKPLDAKKQFFADGTKLWVIGSDAMRQNQLNHAALPTVKEAMSAFDMKIANEQRYDVRASGWYLDSRGRLIVDKLPYAIEPASWGQLVRLASFPGREPPWHMTGDVRR